MYLFRPQKVENNREEVRVSVHKDGARVVLQADITEIQYQKKKKQKKKKKKQKKKKKKNEKKNEKRNEKMGEMGEHRASFLEGKTEIKAKSSL